MGKSIEVICFGELLWDVLPDQKYPGGAPMNVAVNLVNRGVSAALLSRVGTDTLGIDLLNKIEAKGIHSDFIQIDSINPTGTVNLDISDPLNVTYTIHQNVAWDYIEFHQELEILYRNAKLFIYGSLAARSPKTRNTLFQILEQIPYSIFDANLRSPYYERHLLENLLAKANMIKLNEEELNEISSWYDKNDLSEYRKAKLLQNKFNLDSVLISRGANGAAVLQGDEYHEFEGYTVKVKSTTGSGDAFLAGWVSQILKGVGPAKALRYACALGGLVATHIDPSPEITEEAIQSIINV